MTTPANLSYAVEQRLRLIDFLLRHDLAPANMALNPTDKTYYRTVAFASVWP